MATLKPCNLFQRGKCHYGKRCKFSHVLDTTTTPSVSSKSSIKNKPCLNYMRGSCQRGTDCTNSHDERDIEFARSVNGVRETGRKAFETSETLLKDFRWTTQKNTKGMRPLNDRGRIQFFDQASRLVDGEVGTMQEAIGFLASEGGLLRIEELLNQPVHELGAKAFSDFLDDQLLPYFRILDHDKVLSSIILRPKIVALYNNLYLGDGTGERAVKLFTTVFSHFANTGLSDKPSAIRNLETCLAVLGRLVEVNTTTHANPAYRAIADECASILARESTAQTLSFMKAKREVQRIQQRLGMSQLLRASQSEHGRSTTVRAVFKIIHDLPGDLSEEGKRHDNDHADIKDISIMPTIEEIESSRNEYLPLADPKEWHLQGVAGLVDRHFRLLREDTIGQLRDAAKIELAKLRHFDPNLCNSQRQVARTYVYRDVHIAAAAFDEHYGLQIVIGFARPLANFQRMPKARQDWWESCKRLRSDAVICLLSSEGSATFLTVAPEKAEPTSLQKTYKLASEGKDAYVIAQPTSDAQIDNVLALWLDDTAQDTLSLVEFPGVLLPAFVPTLQAMQSLSISLQLPYSDILAPELAQEDSNKPVNLPPPLYTLQPDFRFDLSSIMHVGQSMQFAPGDDAVEASQQLSAHSSLDPAQARAVIYSLSHSLTCIQGPPGTGKSFTGVAIVRAQLANRERSGIGPIIIVTFTNHALDQILERLLQEGVENIIRLGSRSKSEVLQECNLREVAVRLGPTKTEKAERWTARENVNSEAQRIRDILISLDTLGNCSGIRDFLRENSPEHYRQLFESDRDDDGFQRVRRKNHDELKAWLASGAQTDRPQSLEKLWDADIHTLSRGERRSLHQSWCSEHRTELCSKLEDALSAYKKYKEALEDVRSELDSRVLRQANIIGLTTSGLARKLDLLRTVPAKVLICEEAGEVIEAHMLTALLPSIEHTILIGDHQQLRPHVQNYNLSMESRSGSQYALDMSLFERLVKPLDSFSPAVTCCTLEVQRRMHPSISQLIRQTQYPSLEDSPSVSQYPEVAGMRRRLFWMHHEHLEDEGVDEIRPTSHTNAFEVDMVAALVKHVTQQGIYASHEVAVITPYLGQLKVIRDKLQRTFAIVLNDRDVAELEHDGEEVDAPPDKSGPTATAGTLNQALRIATVDNFQGEEAKVVIVSLVRSNTQNKPGFIATPNRINVLLSRAQHGMYILGNANTTENVPMWCSVLETMRSNGNFGPALELCCPRHQDTPMVVSQPADFLRLSPESGCDLVCEKQLQCGHACTAKCHSDLLHGVVHCMKPCTRMKNGCDHLCPKVCGDDCDAQCQSIVDDLHVELECDHTKTSLPCYQYQNISLVVCQEPVQSVVPGCGHVITHECHVDINDNGFRCDTVCAKALACGHTCQRPCHQCNQRSDGQIFRENHGNCSQPCGRAYPTCKHHCIGVCHSGTPCPLCTQPCDNRCSHSACGKKCSEPCTPCLEADCSSGQHCPHSRPCTLPCAAPCNWIPCSKRCEETLTCGCRCPSVCGEVCPSEKFCQSCGGDDVKSLQADLIMLTAYKDINLDNDPCIFAPCGHVFTMASLDGATGMSDHYRIDPDSGIPMDIKGVSEPLSDASVILKTCPECRGTLRGIARYGRIIRRALLDDSTKKLVIWSNVKHTEFTSRLIGEQTTLLRTLETLRKPDQDIKLTGRIDTQIKIIRRLATRRRYKSLVDLIFAVEKYAKQVDTAENPMQRVHDLVEHARITNATNKVAAEMRHNAPEIQPREHLQAWNLRLRCYAVLVSDIISVHKETPPTRNKGILDVDLADERGSCAEVAEKARTTQNVLQQAEASLLWATFAALECSAAGEGGLHDGDTQSLLEKLNRDALDRLNTVDHLCQQQTTLRHNRGITSTMPTTIENLTNEAAKIRKILQEGVADVQMQMVVSVMAKEFRGTGHWYRCANQHPFTVGECGMPMELATCPECGAGVGGMHHQATEGVTHARDLEERFGRLET